MLDSLQSLNLVCLFTAFMWMSYIPAVFYSNGTSAKLYLDGVWKKMQYDDEKILRVPSPAWAIRAQAAHKNAVENLVIFAPLVILCHIKGVGADMPAFVYLLARLVHFAGQIIGPNLPAVRTLAFAVGWMACVAMGLLLL